MIRYRKFLFEFRRSRAMHEGSSSARHHVRCRQTLLQSIDSSFAFAFLFARMLPSVLQGLGSSNEQHSGQTSYRTALSSFLQRVRCRDLACSKASSGRSIPNNCRRFQRHFDRRHSLPGCLQQERLLANFLAAQLH